MKSDRQILEFVKCITEEKYAQAHKYLKLLVVEKFKGKIRRAIKTQRLF